MGFLKRIEMATGLELPLSTHSSQPGEIDIGVRDKYKDSIRQLPAKDYIDKLVGIYFANFNWQYYPMDPDIFNAQLSEWNSLPFSIFSTVGPSGLSPDMRVFPALLFQIAATALLVLPEGPDPVFDALKYAGDMRFEDLATDYSDSGCAILDLLDKKDLSLVTVQAQFLRATFYKFTARVTKAVSLPSPSPWRYKRRVLIFKQWHTISIAIRDAQDLGMHSDSLDPQPKNSSAEAILENQWLIQRRRRMYALLTVWDLNCALVLGRPGTIDWNQTLPTAPIDAPVPQHRSKTPVVPRSRNDRPTPITVSLWIHQLCGPLHAIQNLDAEMSSPQSFEKVMQIHQSILELDSRTPPELVLDNPDTRFDKDSNVHWIQAARLYVAQLYQFGLMALHRPYVFHQKQSRTEAVKASLRMLEIQQLTFEGLSSDSWRNYLLFFGSFDAIVLIASVYIMFPHEQTGFTDKIAVHFQWTVERFSAMQERNPLAKSAQGVLKAIIARFKKAVASAQSVSPSTVGDRLTTESSMASLGLDSTPQSVSDEHGLAQSRNESIYEWMAPSEDNSAMAMPFFPTGDLIFNELTTIPDGSMVLDPGMGIDDFPWQFEGDWADNSVWQMLNQCPEPG